MKIVWETNTTVGGPPYILSLRVECFSSEGLNIFEEKIGEAVQEVTRRDPPKKEE